MKFTLVRFYKAKEGRIFEAEDLDAALAKVAEVVSEHPPDFDEFTDTEEMFLIDEEGKFYDVEFLDD